MKITGVVRVLSLLLFLLAVALSVPLIISLYSGDTRTAVAFAVSIGASLFVALFAFLLVRSSKELGIKESYGIVTFGWILMTLFGALPLWLWAWLSRQPLPYTDCCFEIMSGLTTTGASIFADVEALPKGILFWRSLTHWLGGMGIIVLTLAILPLIGMGGVSLFRAESPGPVSDKLRPRIKDTAKILWGVYTLVTVAEVLLLFIGGMSLFDAFCHTFATVATGGFSTKNISLMAYPSVFIQCVIIFFMFISGANFFLHFQALRGEPRHYLRSTEFKVYTILFAAVTLVVTLDLLFRSSYPIGRALLNAAFQVVSIGTTTGFVNDDFSQWGSLSIMLLFLLMFVGGCGGSTGGGMKVMRIILLFKYALTRMNNLLHPQGIFRVRVEGKAVHDSVLYTVSGFFILYIFSIILSVLVLSLQGIDFQSALSGAVSCIGNVGPALGRLGPMDNYAWLPPLSKWVLMFNMLLGRLEIYTVLLLCLPETWKR